MRLKLPAGFELGIEGLYVIAIQGGPEERRKLALLLKQVENKCRRVIGEDRALPVGPLRIFHARDEAGYERAFKAELGKAFPGYLGACDVQPPPRLFGLASVGEGSMTHELVHVLLMNDSPRMPGWFNEGLAVALGCPVVGYRSEKGVIKDIGLYVAQEALRQGKWSTLERTLDRRELPTMRSTRRRSLSRRWASRRPRVRCPPGDSSCAGWTRPGSFLRSTALSATGTTPARRSRRRSREPPRPTWMGSYGHGWVNTTRRRWSRAPPRSESVSLPGRRIIGEALEMTLLLDPPPHVRGRRRNLPQRKDGQTLST